MTKKKSFKTLTPGRRGEHLQAGRMEMENAAGNYNNLF
jgi:hypothetical protein